MIATMKSINSCSLLFLVFMVAVDGPCLIFGGNACIRSIEAFTITRTAHQHQHHLIGKPPPNHDIDTLVRSRLFFKRQQRTEIQSYANSFSSATRLASSPSSLQENGGKGDARAGEQGYSLTRQPALANNNWDPNADPDFEVPTSLDEESEQRQQSLLDESWWTRRDGRGDQDESSSSALLFGNPKQRNQNFGSNNRNGDGAEFEQDKEAIDDNIITKPSDLNLFQRSLDTLDFGRVLQALQSHCTTLPSRRMVRQATSMSQEGKTSSISTIIGGDPSAFSLLASSPEECRARYRAVQELTWLLQGGTGSVDLYSSPHTTYRDRRGYKQTLAGSPPPLAGNAFALEALLTTTTTTDPTANGGNGYYDTGRDSHSVAEFVSDVDKSKNSASKDPFQGLQQRVLQGSELLEIVKMMDVMENLVLWGQALRTYSTSNAKDSTDNDEVLQFIELPKITDAIVINATLHELLKNAFDESDQGSNSYNNNDPRSTTTTAKLSGTTFPAIGRLRQRVRSLKSNIIQRLETLAASPSMKSKLALESGGAIISQVNGRLVLPLDATAASATIGAGLGMIHDRSRSGKTVYVEPTEIVEPTNELRQAESELRAEEARIWRLLTAEVVAHRPNRAALETSVQAAGQLDLVMARILLGRELKGVIPTVGDEGVVSIRNAKHPVLLLRKVKNVVGSTVELGQNGNQGLVLTGPNSGGKTVILKLLGLMALMARCGIPIPADDASVKHKNGDEDATDYDDFDYGDNGSIDKAKEESESPYVPRVDFFDPILADIGDIQSVGGDLSTFSGHMLVCREVLANAGRNALVLMDELGSGTDPAQGVAIAQALLEAILDTGARVAITTHYMQLKQLAASDDRFAVGGMQFINGRPTYKLLPGTVGESFALAVAERLKLPKSVLERANTLLDSETRQMGDLIRELEDQKALVDQQAKNMKEQRKKLAQLEQETKAEQIRLEKKQLGARREEARKFAKMLEEKEAVLESVLEKLKSDPSRRIVAKSWDDIRFVKRDAINEAENVPSVLARKKKVAAAVEEASAELVPIAELRDKPELKEGDALVVCKQGPLFGREGKIVKALSNQVELKVGNMNVSLKLTQIALPIKGATYSIPSDARGSSNSANGGSGGGPKSVSKAAARAIADEQSYGGGGTTSRGSSSSSTSTVEQPKSSSVMRTQSNTVDVRGCNLEEAKDLVKQKFSSCIMAGRPVVFILHGHGTGGILKKKVRGWLQSERQLVKKFSPAEMSDGGDAFTRVELK